MCFGPSDLWYFGVWSVGPNLLIFDQDRVGVPFLGCGGVLGVWTFSSTLVKIKALLVGQAAFVVLKCIDN